MKINRTFLNWNNPAVESLIDYIYKNSPKDCIDYSNLTIVLPTQRAGRRLHELLALDAEKKQRAIIPPITTTVGALINKVLNIPDDLPDATIRELAWLDCIENNKTVLISITKSEAELSFQDKVSWARQFERTYKELASSQVTTNEIAEYLKKQGLIEEASTWLAIQRLFADFPEHLSKYGEDRILIQQTALEKKDYLFNGKLLFVACIDLPVVAKKVIERLSAQTEILVIADEKYSDCFDQFGCLHSDSWQIPKYDLDQARFHLVEKFYDQANQVANILDRYKDSYACEEITIASVSEESWHPITDNLRRLGLNVHPAVGRYIKNSQIFLLIQLIASYFNNKDFSSFASLIRHPIFLDLVMSKTKFPNIIDTVNQYYMNHLVDRLDFSLIINNEKDLAFKVILDTTNDIISKLNPDNKDLKLELVINNFIKLIEELIAKNSDQEIYEDFEALCEIVGNYLVATEVNEVKLGTKNFLELLLHHYASLSFPQQRLDSSIDLVGWLELQFDDAKLKIITDFSEGLVPEAINTDWLMPNSLREVFKLVNNKSRLARDSYILSTVIASSQNVHIISSKKTIDNNYTMPSRLIYNLNNQNFPEYINNFLQMNPVQFASKSFNKYEQPLMPPLPNKSKQFSEIGVSAVNEYLRCPYSFYLKYVEELQEVKDYEYEMGALLYGNVIHSVLRDFASSELRDSSDKSLISNYFEKACKQYELNHFGKGVVPAVTLQFELIKQKLQKFSEIQSNWVKEGWRIYKTEWSWPKEKMEFNTGSSKILLKGRIDRIDYNKSLNQYAIFDYKTGSSQLSAEKSHRKKLTKAKEQANYSWINIQLPAYAKAWQTEYVDCNLDLGYISIGSDINDIKFDFVDWSKEDIDSANETILECLKSINNNQFWPPKVFPKEYDPSYRLFVNSKINLDLLQNITFNSEEVGE
jgi:hypothetical protein